MSVSNIVAALDIHNRQLQNSSANDLGQHEASFDLEP